MEPLISLHVDPRLVERNPAFVNMLKEVAEKLFKLALVKNENYKDSYRKRGERSLQENWERKRDRMETLLENARLLPDGKNLAHDSLPSGTESMCESLGDLANYSEYWIGYAKEVRADEFAAWSNGIERQFEELAQKL